MDSLPSFNPDLPFIRNDWNGNPFDGYHRFVNLDGPSERSWRDLMRWQLAPKPFKELKKKQEPGVSVIQRRNILAGVENSITWLGHASFLFTLGRRNFITDPVLYGVSLIKRQTELPCEPSDLKSIDFILLSHNHRDHCDKKSLQLLSALNPEAILCTGLGIGRLLKKWGIRNPSIEMGWYQQFVTEDGIRISYLPARHWNRRGLNDLNDMLWGSFMLEYDVHSIYFGADSGMGIHFEEIRKLFPEIGYALLGIGAYMPEWFMHPSHTSPAEALNAFDQLGARYMIPMHHATFDLSDEPLYYPRQVLQQLVSEKNIPHVLDPAIGETIYINNV